MAAGGMASTLDRLAEHLTTEPTEEQQRMTTQTQLVTGVDFAMVPTTDLERSVAFYTETLGLPAGPRCATARTSAPSSRPAT